MNKQTEALYSQSLQGHSRRPGGQLSVSAALEGARAAVADGRTAQRAAAARGEDGGQPEQEPDCPKSHGPCACDTRTQHGMNE